MTPRRHAISSDTAHCPDVDCPCAGDEAAHAAHAEAGSLIECPECGRLSTPLGITTWGHCRACRTAESRLTRPLRW